MLAHRKRIPRGTDRRQIHPALARPHRAFPLVSDGELLRAARRAGNAGDHAAKWALLQEYVSRYWEQRNG